MVTDVLEFGSIEVQTVTRSGTPVSRSKIVLYNDVQIMAEGFTDTDGKYLFKFVPPQIYGVHNEPPKGYMRPEDMAGGTSTSYADQILIEEGSAKKASFTFVKIGPGRINVSVVDLDGTPIEEAEVFLYGPEGELAKKAVGSSGSVSFDPVSFGNRGIRIVPPRPYFDPFEEGSFFQDGFLIDEGWVEEVNFVLEKCFATLRASVQDASGAPFPEYPVRLYSSTSTLELKDTGADGVAVFDSITCGDRGLALVETPGWFFEEGPGLSFYDGISVTRGSDQTFSFTVEPCLGTVRGSVQDAFGVPVTEHPIRLYSSTSTLELEDTGADGVTVFDSIPCGNFGIALTQRPGWTFEQGPGLSFHDGISVTDQSDQTFSFSVEPCSGDVGIRVEDENSNPVSGALLQLYANDRIWDQDVTSADGVLLFTRACGMEVGVKVTPPSGYTVQQGRGFSFFDGLNPESGGRIEVVFRLQSS
jgi:hypothetical protein